MPADTTIVAAVLLLIIPFMVWDGVTSLRAGFNNSFWALPLDDKMDLIVGRISEWHGLSIRWVIGACVLAAGMTGFGFLLGGAGEPVWAGLGVGLFLFVSAVFAFGHVLSTATVAEAARSRKESGTTPEWSTPSWLVAWWMERTFVVGANLAFVIIGIGVVRSGFPAEWAGWVAIITGGLLAAWASFQDYMFQHMALLTPLVLGIALALY